MKKTHFFNTALLSFFTLFSHSVMANNPQAERLYQQNCATCHGKQGEKSAFGQSKILKNLSKTDIITGLQARKNGEIQGAGNRIKERLTEDEILILGELFE